jgi:hypothetical protein
VRSQSGLSLIDSIVALALFLLATATIGQSVVRQIRTGSTNSMQAVAYTLAARELEELRGLDYEAIDDRNSSLREGAIEYLVATSVQGDTPEPNMKEITVEVAWNEPDGPQHVQVRTIFTNVRR